MDGASRARGKHRRGKATVDNNPYQVSYVGDDDYC